MVQHARHPQWRGGASHERYIFAVSVFLFAAVPASAGRTPSHSHRGAVVVEDNVPRLRPRQVELHSHRGALSLEAVRGGWPWPWESSAPKTPPTVAPQNLDDKRDQGPAAAHAGAGDSWRAPFSVNSTTSSDKLEAPASSGTTSGDKLDAPASSDTTSSDTTKMPFESPGSGLPFGKPADKTAATSPPVGGTDASSKVGELAPEASSATAPEASSATAAPIATEVPTEAAAPDAAPTAAPTQASPRLGEDGFEEAAPTAPPNDPLPEILRKKADAAGGADGKPSIITGTPARGGARQTQPWIFSLLMALTLLCFCCGVCGFCFYARRSYRKTEDELRELLEHVNSKTMAELLAEKVYGSPMPRTLLRGRYLIKRAKDDQKAIVIARRKELYKVVYDRLAKECKESTRTLDKKETEQVEKELRERLAVERQLSREKAENEWREYQITDPVPTLVKVEEEMQKIWAEYQKQRQ